jgi:endonuclease YncB( thermonuclease family)
MKRWVMVVVLGGLPWWAQAQVLESAWVSWVMDGDTVMLVPEGGSEPYRLRIQGIDAPESCQSGGERARDALMALVQRRPVRIERHGQDTYGRHLGRMLLDDKDVGAEMVRGGWAWAYSYRSGRGPYAALQREAQKEKRGVFAAREAAMSPAVFRQFHGSCHDHPETQAPVQRVPHTGQAGSR